MYQGMIIAGFGGQGVVSAGILAAYAGTLEDKNVSFFPSYGPEMRGGTANCSVVISTEEVASPIVTKPTSLIVMNEPSLVIFEQTVEPGGCMFVNSSLIKSKPKRNDIDIINVPVNDIAAEVGNPKSANMVMLGAFCKKTGALKLESIFNAIPHVFTKATKEMIDKNIAAIKKGAESVI
ncbi:2-oxoacid:acceptor oxidoreductase family protein [bacterium]|nr:2-oxoacid:acceptor oxidoreductase family protein [bacterium]